MMKKALLLAFLLTNIHVFATDSRPNIVWIFVEDMNNWMGCYGDETVPTPNIDKLAESGLRFDRAYMPAAVCSAVRSAIALGSMQTTFGVHNHRSSRQRTPHEKFKLPEHIKTVYQLLRRGGYHVINAGPKNDFNFLWPTQDQEALEKVKGKYGHGAYPSGISDEWLYDVNSQDWGYSPNIWKDRPVDKPVFIQFQLKGGKNSGIFKNAKTENGKETIKIGNQTVFTALNKVEVMPYYPDLPVVRKEIAHHYDCIRQTDDEVGQIIAELKKEGLYENTVIFFWTDHGMRLPRHKQWLYEGGIRVPLIIFGPGIPKGKVRKDLMSGIDITATTLALSGTKIPDWMEGQNLFDNDFKREYVISARDRCDYTIERVRAVTTNRFKYIRNFLTDRSFMQPQYRDGTAFVKDMRAYYETGKMNKEQSFIWSEIRVPEELYDLKNDPHEINNLSNEPKYLGELKKHQKILKDWIRSTDDKGQYPESKEALEGVLRQWSKQAVNPEYDIVRKTPPVGMGQEAINDLPIKPGKPKIWQLWPGKPPGEILTLSPEFDITTTTDNLVAGRRVTRLHNVSSPNLTIYKPDPAIDTKTAVIIAPGGGQWILAYDLEGTEIAAWLNSIGVTAIILKYRVPGIARSADKRWLASVQDGQRAVCLVRGRAQELGIDPQKIGFMGFSAGGAPVNYTALTSKRLYDPVDQYDSISFRPNFAAPIYAGGFPEGAELSEDCPPFFMVITHDDQDRSIKVAEMYIALKKANISAELHIYESGGHGYGLRRTELPVTTWPDRMEDWLRRLGFLEH